MVLSRMCTAMLVATASADMCSPFITDAAPTAQCSLNAAHLSELEAADHDLHTMLLKQVNCLHLLQESCEADGASQGCRWSDASQTCEWTPSPVDTSVLMRKVGEHHDCGWIGRTGQTLGQCTTGAADSCPADVCQTSHDLTLDPEQGCVNAEVCNTATGIQLQSLFSETEQQALSEAHCSFDDPSAFFFCANGTAEIRGFMGLAVMGAIGSCSQPQEEDSCVENDACVWTGRCQPHFENLVPAGCPVRSLAACADSGQDQCLASAGCEWTRSLVCEETHSTDPPYNQILELGEEFRCMPSSAAVAEALGGDFGARNDLTLFAAHSLAALRCHESGSACDAGYDALPAAAARLVDPAQEAPGATPLLPSPPRTNKVPIVAVMFVFLFGVAIGGVVLCPSRQKAAAAPETELARTSFSA